MTPRVIWVVLGALAAIAISPLLGAPLDEASASFVLHNLRIPRVALGAIIGASLAISGAAFQVVLENPLATPATMGTTAGAALGALCAIVLGPAGLGAAWIGAAAFVGAATASLGITALAASPRLRTEELLLAGVAVMLGAGAATTGLQLQADAAATLASVRWSLGSLSTVGWGDSLRMLPFALVGIPTLLLQRRALQAMVAGSARASSQGVPVVRTRTIVLLAGSLMVAGTVAVAGPIAFVGLIVPHLVRRVVGGGPDRILPLSAIAGAGFLPLADGLARWSLPGRDLPVGVVMAMLGAPALLFLLLNRRGPR
jgi:iron complex transport system permease protein